MKPTKKLQPELRNENEAENLQLRDALKRQADEITRMSRELEIEAALEEVRSRSLAMHKSDELKDVVNVVFKELRDLNIVMDSACILTFNQSTRGCTAWAANPDLFSSTAADIPFFEDAITKVIYEARDNAPAFIASTWTFQEKNAHWEYLFEHSDWKYMPDDLKKAIREFDGWGFTGLVTKNSATFLVSYTEKLFSEQENEIIRRLGSVFDQAYIRFLDLQKAEALARAAQVETALEKIRSRSLEMNHSGELKEVITVTFEKLTELNVLPGTVGIQLFDQESMNSVAWVGTTIQDPQMVNLPYDKQIMLDDNFLKDTWKAMKGGVDLINEEYSFEQKNQYFNHLFAHNDLTQIPQQARDFLMQMRRHIVCVFTNKNSAFFVDSWNGEEFPKESREIIKRAAKVFEQAYIRFLDLQKAEAQARESQIQLALERVRARTMAMQHSDELKDAAALLFQQVKSLGVPAYSCGYNIWEKDEKVFTSWMSTQDGSDFNAVLNIPLTEDANFVRFAESRQKGEQFFVLELRGERMQEHYQYLKTIPAFKAYFDYAISVGFDLPKTQIHHLANFSQGNLLFITLEPCPEFHDVFKRFAAVFEQTYTRFLDLQKAEAQARESQIEASLEKVRGRAMGMHRSDELSEVLSVLFDQFDVLNIRPVDVHLDLFDLEKNTFSYRATGKEGMRVIAEQIVDLDSRPEWQSLAERWKQGKPNTVGFSYYPKEVIRELMAFFPDIWAAMPPEAIMNPEEDFPDGIYDALGYCKFGYLGFHHNRKTTEEENRILIRFANEFERLYQRFLDLQKAEAQARESQIQLALERVRARTMAMQRSEEMAEVAALLFQQVQAFGITSWSCGFNIWEPDDISIASYMAKPDGTFEVPSGFRLPHTEHPHFIQSYEARKRGEEFFVIEAGGKELEDTYRYMFSFPEWKRVFGTWEDSGFPVPAFQISHYVFFSQGYLLFITYEPVPELWDIFKRFGKVFEQTYTRFLDLQTAEAQARESQIQLALERVRARTMAMQRSDELPDAASLLFKQMEELGVKSWSSGFNIWEPDGRSATINMCNPDGSLATPYHLPHTEQIFFKKICDARERGDELLVMETGGKELEDTYNFMFSLPDVKRVLGDMADTGFPIPKFQVNHCAFFSQGYLMFITYEPVPELWDVFKRFAKVFEQTYTRFLDLQKAEAQAREAQIEAALERVRSRSMGMQKSEELKEVIQVVYDQFIHLNIKVGHTGFVMDYKTRDDYNIWIADPLGVPSQVTIPYFDSVYYNRFNEAKKNGENFFTTNLGFEEKNKFYQRLFEYVPGLPEEAKKFYFNCPGLAASTVLLDNVCLYIENFSGTPYSDEENKTLMRFGKVFQQTYTRFLDLQKAEAQAREAKIEAVLERIRSRTMAMQKSDELTDVAGLLFKQVTDLGIKTWTAGFNVWSEDNNSYVDYITSPNGGFIEPYTVFTDTAEALTDISNARKSGVEFDVQYVEGEKIKQLYLALTRLDEKQYEIMLQDGIRFPSHQYEHFVFGSKVSLMFITYEPVPEAHDIFKRLGKVFEQTYTRFLDLQRSEAQARESQIQLALERVRARTMAMQHSNELQEVVNNVYERLGELEVEMDGAAICTFIEGSKDYHVWIGGLPEKLRIKFNDLTQVQKDYNDVIERRDELFIKTYSGKIKKEYIRFLLEETMLNSTLPEDQKQVLMSSDFFTTVISCTKNTAFQLYRYNGKPFLAEETDILKRFAKVFEQAYIRFLDLQKAEAQAKEAKVETALEKVRSRTMAMQKSGELAETASLLFQQIKSLGIETYSSGFTLWDNDDKTLVAWMCNADGSINPPFKMPANDIVWHKRQYESWKKGEDFIVNDFTGEEMQSHYRYLRSFPLLDEAFKTSEAAGIKTPERQVHNISNFSRGNLLFITFEPCPEFHDIFKRFAKVFEQTYTRFLDLQKAEAQAREAKVETALEKVRSRTMAMQKSAELGDVAAVLFKEMNQLVENLWTCGFVLCEKDRSEDEWWLSAENGFIPAFYLPNTGDVTHANIYQGWLNGESYHTEQLEGIELEEHYEWLMNIPIAKKIFDDLAVAGIERPQWQKLHCAYFSKGYLCIITQVPCTEEPIFKRFAQVFDLTYTRFLDLQKAEAQAREAQIEAALEKVRSRSLAMHSANELGEVVKVIVEKLQDLGVVLDANGVVLCTYFDGSKDVLHWIVSPDFSMTGSYLLPYFDHPIFNQAWQSKENRDEYFSKAFSVEEKNSFFEYAFEHSDYKYFPEDFKKWVFQNDKHILSFAWQTNSAILIPSHTGMVPNEAEKAILIRFARVFEQAYVRFMDLQKSEEQAREAIKQASVDRIRAEIASMRTTNDLERIQPLIWNELTTLGVPFTRCGVFILDEEHEQVETFLSTPEGKSIASFTSGYSDVAVISEALPYWRNKEIYKAHWDEATFLAQAQILLSQGNITSTETYLTGHHSKDLYLHFLPFLQGILYVGNEAPLSDAELQLVQNLADAFSIAYARYEDFNKLELAKQQIENTLVDLKQTQAQLVQSEKMASLGELTAGIAHEIQNPLNFVNNFSEVNRELLSELKAEIEKGNIEEVKAIANDIIGNEEKINHHGKRADAIVKGMLQHSRMSSGQKEPTDINALCDEYLRLAYHGLRAKDKSFNAKFETHLDKSIGKISVIPQDIGRVLVNLINNAFYAVNEKQKQASAGVSGGEAASAPNGYAPAVTVTSKKDGDGINLSVSDNGSGIPQKVLDKIFQPFFTTKPSGQGTGLGLSLAYDIIKTHNGDIKVESKEKEGTTFTIHLPETG